MTQGGDVPEKCNSGFYFPSPRTPNGAAPVPPAIGDSESLQSRTYLLQMNRITNHMPIRGLALLCAVGLAAPAALAQLTETQTISLADHSINAAALSSPVAGCFRIPSIKDIAFLNNGSLIIGNQPGAFSDLNAVASNVTDLVVRPDSVLDTVFVLRSGTPRAMEYNASSGSWAIRSIVGANSGQTRMVKGDVDGDGNDDLVTYSSQSKTITGLRFASSNSSDLYTTFTIPAPPGVLDLACLNWSGTADTEIAVLTNGGIRVYNQGGAVVASFSCPANTESLTAFRNQGEPADRSSGLTCTWTCLTSLAMTTGCTTPTGAGRRMQLGRLGSIPRTSSCW
jgi:hypothetical protein